MSEPSTPQAAEHDGSQANSAAVDLADLAIAYHAAVYRYAYRLCGSPTDAEDLTQQTFLIAQRKLHQLRQAERACAWLLAVVRTCFLKSIRKARPVPVANLEFVSDEESDKTPEFDEIDREQLTAALAELPDEDAGGRVSEQAGPPSEGTGDSHGDH